MDRLYCSVDRVIGWGVKSEKDLLKFIRSASVFIENELGSFIPETDTRRFDGYGGVDLWVARLLTVTGITDDTTVLSAEDYLLYPRNRLWSNGPYDRITIDPNATNIAAWSAQEDIIEIVGRWGLYELTEQTGATVKNNPQDAAQTSLLVSDGGLVRPGMVLLINNEQELVTATGAATDSTATLNGALDNQADIVAVSDGSLLQPDEVIKVDFEQMYITDISGNNLLVERGWNGTTRTTHTTATAVYVHRTFTVTRGANGTTAASHAQDTTIARYLPPGDIEYLCQQTASLMSRKEDSGYAGKTGNVELGEVFYIEDYPKDFLNKLRSYYFIPVT